MMPLYSMLLSFFQSITVFDLITIATLVLLEAILSVDNALVLAILVRRLPENMRRKALTYGLVGAVVFRLIALIFAVYLLQFSIVKLLGGIYLIYISLKHLFLGFLESEKRSADSSAGAFWKVVFLVEMTDIVFSIDAVTTAIAFSDKVWVLWIGGIAGIIAMRFTSSLFVGLLEKFPRMEDLAYQLVFFVGAKLSFEVFGLELEHAVFWLMMGVITILGISLIYREHKVTGYRRQTVHTLLDDLKKGKITVAEVLSRDKVLTAEFYHALLKEGYLRPGEGHHFF